MSHLEPIRAVRAVDQVVDLLRGRILGGVWAPGAALPGERGLAEELGVSRLTLRAALGRLETEGLVAARQGDAVRVRDWRRHGSLALLPHLLGVPAVAPSLRAAFLELRRSIAGDAVALACDRATREQRLGLRALAAAQELEEDRARFFERDLTFTRALLEAAANDAMLLLFNSVEGVYRADPALAAALLDDLEAVRPSYAGICALVESGAPDRAREAVRAVLAAQDARALRRLSRPARPRRSSR